ncbi:NHS actin remodeling regulator GUK-holder [Aphomia sociella]
MPFVQRVVEPKYLSRTSLRGEDGRPKVNDEELQAVTNCTLSNALRQLASLVLLAEDIFSELTSQLQGITERSKLAQTKIEKINEIVVNYDPKKVPVPEGSLSDFAVRKVHYTASNPLKKGLFTPDTRPASLRNLYEKATTDRLSASILDQLRRDSQYSPYLLCTPILSTKRRRIYQKVDVDIETHIPSVVEHLRKWTSKEAVGDVTALPDASMRIANSVTLTPDELSECGSGDDEPIDHRLPSPEEQLRVIASKFPPEVVAIDTSGKFFDRMCTSRKSLHIEVTGETDTVKRRTRTRKPRGKRRNTISGTDQKELREAIAGDTSIAVATEEVEDNSTVIRSKSSDLLKKSPIDPVTKKGHFNSLKQWGKNRLKMIGRSPSASRDSFKENLKIEKSKESKSPTEQDESELQETVTMRKKRPGEEDRRTHQRCASYSSSEKSIGVPASIPTTATINSTVKLRGTSVQRRLRRSGIGKDEPHSSSGNWSASSESGRTSIGSEITTTTVPPKSTTSAATSNNSLNLHHGPPSSIISRRRFMNTSGSGSVTSEGTLTPDIIHDLHEDLETSSEFSCDTEGYYTSFHMDSGLKTLKEEEICPSTPMHTSNALSNSSNSQTLTAENEYELFGKGSTSTTTSSAGTVCTALMAAGSDRSLVIGPTVPERKSSLSKIMRTRSNNIHSANASLDRSINSSFSKSPFSSLKYNSVQSYPDKKIYNHSSPEISEVPNSTITITRNVGNHREITAVAEVHTETELESAKKSTGTSSPDSGHNTSSSPIEDSVSSAHGKNSLSEQDYSESSDLEGTDRIERIRYKTTINSSRIPSLCVITPNQSDDESEGSSNKDSETCRNEEIDESLLKKVSSRPKLDLPSEEKSKETKNSNEGAKPNKPYTQINLKSSLQPLNNLMCKLKGVLPHKLSNKKSPTTKEPNVNDDIYDAGDYVTIADVKNNNQKMSLNRGIYGNNDIIRKNLQAVLSGRPETEYVSLNELPNCLSGSKDFLENTLEEKSSTAMDEIQIKGAKVTLDSQGHVIYSSDTLRRRKGAHTTFEPGPFVQEVCPTTTIIQRETADVVKLTDETDFPYDPASSKPTSPQLGKLIIKAPIEPDGPVTTEFVPLPPHKPSTIITATPLNEPTPPINPQSVRNQRDLPRVVEAITRTGAYVNIHDAEGVSLSPTKDDLADYRHSCADKPYLNIQQSASHEKAPMVNLNALIPTQHRYNTAHLRGRHGVVNYDNNHSTQLKEQPQFWTLPKRSSIEINTARPRTPEQRQLVFNYPTKSNPRNLPHEQLGIPHAPNVNNESIRISPIDPRTTGSFKSSTPSNKENVVDLSTKLLSPVKSTMTNEELYAVIHKSKKKLNIKDSAERAESPALSTISLSPVSSETSLYTKGTQRHPETGYLGDPRSRMSWSPADKQHLPPYPNSGVQKQETTSCADRYGPVPQTSRLDFKKLLLQHSVKLNTLQSQNKTNKLSAVEQLKISKEKVQLPLTPTTNRTQMNILDLSGSPKTYTQRKIIKANPQPASPGRTGALIKEHKNTPKILLSPKSQWRFSSPRSDVLSTPIPEVNNEDENSNSSGERHDTSPNNPPSKTVPIVTNQHFGARRNLIPINENNIETENDFPESIDHGVFPLNTDFAKSHGLSRSEIMQAKRAEFFNKSPDSSPPKFTSFKNPSAASSTRSKSSPERGETSPTTLETAL